MQKALVASVVCAAALASSVARSQPADARSYGYQPGYGGQQSTNALYGATQPTQTTTVASTDSDATLYATFLDLLSIRVGSYRITGSDADTITVGFLFSLDPDIIRTEDYLTARSTWYAAIGGGSDGLEGQLESSSRIGVRGYFGDDHGPFARAGLGFQFLGNNKLYRSQFELPQLEAGYQVMTPDLLFELAATGSLVLGGRYFTGDHAERRIDTEPALGANLTLQVDPLRFHASAQRIFAAQTGPGSPIDQLQAHLCLRPLGPVLVCAHGAFHRGDVRHPDGSTRESTATYFGGTLGLGGIENGTR